MRKDNSGIQVGRAVTCGARRANRLAAISAKVLVCVGLLGIAGCSKKGEGSTGPVDVASEVGSGRPTARPTEPLPSPARSSYQAKLEAVRRLLKVGETEAGLKAARELLDDHRIDAEGWLVYATANQIAGDSKEALRAANAATELDPKNAAAWVAVGAAERMTGGYTAADLALRRALELDPGSRAARFNLAGIAADKGQHEVARKELTALVEADPDDFETRFLLATTFLAQREIGPAKEQLAKIVERYPQHFKSQRALAAIAWAEGNYQRAFERATIAARINGNDPEVTRLLEGSFYVIAAARLRCAAGERPPAGWTGDNVVEVLTAIEKEQGLEGAGSFVEIDQRLGEDPTVRARVEKAAASCLPEKAPAADANP